MTAPETRRPSRLIKIAAITGFVVGLVCSSLPPKYQTACSAVSHVLPHACG